MVWRITLNAVVGVEVGDAVDLAAIVHLEEHRAHRRVEKEDQNVEAVLRLHLHRDQPAAERATTPTGDRRTDGGPALGERDDGHRDLHHQHDGAEHVHTAVEVDAAENAVQLEELEEVEVDEGGERVHL